MNGPLPAYGDYFRAILALGRRSIRPALPAIVFVYFYRLGMGLYLILARGEADPGTVALPTAAAFVTLSAGYLPMLVLVYTPFLPFMDGLLRDTRADFLAAVRHVLEVALKLFVSLAAQLAIVAVPTGILLAVGAGLAAGVSGGWLEHIQAGEELSNALRGMIVLAFSIPAIFWVLYSAMHLLFATPALVLSGRGPFASIRVSWKLVGGRFWGLLGRLLGYAVLLVLASIAFGLPSTFLDASLAASGNSNPMFKIPSLVWVSAVDAFLFPFGVAALILLYRALVPLPSPAGTADASAEAEPRRTSPFVFE
jgi:hypothetical protein